MEDEHVPPRSNLNHHLNQGAAQLPRRANEQCWLGSGVSAVCGCLKGLGDMDTCK